MQRPLKSLSRALRQPFNRLYAHRRLREYHALPDSTGRYSTLYRPIHLNGLELGVSVASAALRNEATGAPICFNADVVATAKRKLKTGEVLDGEGGFCVWGKQQPAEMQLDVPGLRSWLKTALVGAKSFAVPPPSCSSRQPVSAWHCVPVTAPGRGDDEHGDDDEHDDDDTDEHPDDAGERCGTEALVAGAVVHEAELKATSTGAVFEEVEIER